MSESPPDPQFRRGDFAREKGEIVLREHEYDGIQEFDQKLPNWWLFTFYGAVVFTIAYWSLYYYTSSLQTDEQRITGAIMRLQEKKDEELAKTLATLNDESMIQDWVSNPEIVAMGEATYSIYCVACHSADLSSTMKVGDQSIPLPGLSLTDGEWKYGAKPMDLFKIINDGTPADSTGYNGARMQAWGQTLSPKQVAEVTAYVISKNPGDFGL